MESCDEQRLRGVDWGFGGVVKACLRHGLYLVSSWEQMLAYILRGYIDWQHSSDFSVSNLPTHETISGAPLAKFPV